MAEIDRKARIATIDNFMGGYSEMDKLVEEMKGKCQEHGLEWSRAKFVVDRAMTRMSFKCERLFYEACDSLIDFDYRHAIHFAYYEEMVDYITEVDADESKTILLNYFGNMWLIIKSKRWESIFYAEYLSPICRGFHFNNVDEFKQAFPRIFAEPVVRKLIEEL